MSSNRQPPPVTVTVGQDDHLPAILQQLREHSGTSVVLAIPDHCPVLLTATEFRTIKDVADRENITLSLRTEDRLRNQLASMFGIRNVGDVGSETPAEGWRPPPTMLGSPRAYGTWKRTDDDAGESDIHELEPGTRNRRRRGFVDTNTVNRREGDDDDISSLEYLNEKEPFFTPKMIGRIVGAVLLVGLILIALGWYYMPGVTVTATLRQQPVSQQLLYSVAAPGATLPSDISFTADAEMQEATVDFTVTVPTTGVERTPDQTATGSVLLRNPGAEAVTVPAGTTLTIYAGPSYTTDADVEVPPAADGQAGEASVAVTASEAGASGNADAGLLTGQLTDLGIFYSNRDGAIEGGTDIEVPIVAEEDLDRLEEEVRLNLRRPAANGWMEQLPDGQGVVVPSVETGEPAYEITATAGERLEEVSATGTVDVSGLVFDAATVEEQTVEFFRTELQSEVPEGYTLDPGSVVLGEPEVISEAPDNVQYQVEATGVAHAVFDSGDQGDLTDALAGGTWGQARQRLGGIEAFETWDISTNPGWWPDRLPQAPDRITVEVARGTPDDAATPTPAPSPATGNGS